MLGLPTPQLQREGAPPGEPFGSKYLDLYDDFGGIFIDCFSV